MGSLDGTVTDDRAPDEGTVPPKLTIAQRLLTALPSLQRASGPAPADEGGDDTAVGDVDAGTDGAAPTTSGAPEDTDDAPLRPSSGRARTAGGGRTPSGGRAPLDLMDDLSDDEIAYRIKRLDDRERFLVLFAGPLGAVVGIVLTILTFHLNPAVGKANHENGSIILLEGAVRVVLGAAVTAIAFTRRRSLIGFSLLFLGTAMGSPLFALPFWALGGYLIWRVFKYQKVLTARGKSRKGAAAGRATATRGGRAARVPANPRQAARAGVAAGRERGRARQGGKKQPAGPGPSASKRYTPPKPPRPRPPAPSS